MEKFRNLHQKELQDARALFTHIPFSFIPCLPPFIQCLLKTLSTIIGHVSSATTLNVYVNVTDDMRKSAAVKIDQGIAGTESQAAPETMPQKPVRTSFRAKKGKYRKPGTGYISQINAHLWEGRYSPKVNGKRVARNVYAHSEAECEKLLAKMIAEMKTEITAGKELRKNEGKAS